MKVIIAPASTKTGAATIRSLLSRNQASLQTTALYRDLQKVPAEFKSRVEFAAERADVGDASSLDFSGADAVLAITPPAYDGRDIVKHAELVSRNVRDAIDKAGSVKRLVLLSSVGAQFEEGVGELRTNHIAEQVFAATKVPEIVFVRSSYFMENWTMSVEGLKAPEPFFYSTITPLDWQVSMVATKDIGEALAAELVKETPPPAKPHVFDLHGPQSYTPLDVQAAFSKALGEDVALKPVEPHELAEFYGNIFAPSIVHLWVEMSSFLPNGIATLNPSTADVVRGKTELDEALQEATKGI